MMFEYTRIDGVETLVDTKEIKSLEEIADRDYTRMTLHNGNVFAIKGKLNENQTKLDCAQKGVKVKIGEKWTRGLDEKGVYHESTIAGRQVIRCCTTPELYFMSYGKARTKLVCRNCFNYGTGKFKKQAITAFSERSKRIGSATE